MGLPNEIHPFHLAGAGQGYQVSNSLRFRSSGSAHLAKNGSYTTPIFTNGTTFTISAWIKMGIPFSTSPPDFMTFVYTAGNGEQGGIGFGSNGGVGGQIGWWEYNAPSGYFIRKWSTLLLRDPSAWYHCVWVYDSTNATAEDRVRIYVNNVRVTSWAINTNPSQNRTSYFVSNGSGYYPIIGGQNRNGGNQAGANFDGYVCEFNAIDGQALTPSAFGETDSITGAWNPKKYTGTYGTNGFYLPFNTPVTSSFSGSFNGSNQYLQATLPATLTGAFTVEYFLYRGSSGNQFMFTLGDSATSSGLEVYIGSTGTVLNGLWGGSGQITSSGTTTTIPVNDWSHIAITRDASNNIRMFLNGVQVGSTVANSNAINNTLRIGVEYFSAGILGYLNGSLSNFRIINGTCLYTSKYNVPAQALTAISGTSILTLQNATVIDNSGNSLSITNNGTVSMSAATPWTNFLAGQDLSGNGNGWKSSGISLFSPANTVTYLHDSYIDVPTNWNDGSTTYNRGNYPTLNSVDPDGGSYAINGNLQTNGSPTGGGPLPTIALPKTGKWLFEALSLGSGGSGIVGWFGVANADAGNFSGLLSRIAVNPGNGYYQDDALVQSGYIGGNNIVYTMAIDIDNKILYIYFDGVYQRSLTITSANVNLFMFYSGYTGSTGYVNYGQRPFRYPQTGYLALNTYNIPNPSLPLV